MEMLKLQAYAGPAPALPEKRRAAWELIGRGKLVMEQKLKGHDLALQGITLGWEKMNLEQITAAIKAYKVEFAILQSDRKDFTVWLDEAKAQCMPIENSWKPDTNPLFASMTAREIMLRKEATSGVNEANEKLQEIAAFKTHCITELQNLACDYRDKLRDIVHQAYIVCIRQKTPPDQVLTATNAALAAMRVVSPRDMVPFIYKKLSYDEADKIYQTLVKPDYTGILNDCIKELNDKFTLYANDLQNADQLVEVVEQTYVAEQAQQREQDASKAQAAALYVKATTEVLKVVPGVKPVTEQLQIKRDQANKVWVATIMSAFLAHFDICMEKVRTKKDNPDYTTLNIDRMATALDACNIKVDGVEYEKFTK